MYASRQLSVLIRRTHKKNMNIELPCEHQLPFHPSEDRSKFCAALCKSHRQCHNKAVKFNPYANILLRLKSNCIINCYLCEQHHNVAISIARSLGSFMLEKVISSSLDLEQYLLLSALTNGRFSDGNDTSIPNVSFPYAPLDASFYNGASKLGMDMKRLTKYM